MSLLLLLNLEVVEADDGVDEAVDVVGGGGGPLEAEAIEDLSGVVVGGFYPAHYVFAADVVGHQGAQERDEVGILHHLLQGLLELSSLYALQGDASLGKAYEDVAEELAVCVAGMEHDALLGRLRQEHDSMCHLVDGRELIVVVEVFVRHHTYYYIRTQAGEEVVGVEVDLELAVLLACREVADAHDLGVEAVVGDGIEHEFLGFVLGIDVFVGIDVLPDVEVLFRQLHLGAGLAVHAQAGDAVGGDMDEAGSCAQAEGDEVTHGLDVHHLDVVAGGEVLHVGDAVDHTKLRVES